MGTMMVEAVDVTPGMVYAGMTGPCDVVAVDGHEGRIEGTVRTRSGATVRLVWWPLERVPVWPRR